MDFWLGLRHDWRSGYEEPVLIETATAEQDLAAVFGLRWGPLIFETVQQFDNDASYGQVRLVAAGFDDARAGAEQASVQFDTGITVPDAYLVLAGRWQADWLNRGNLAWHRSLYIMGGHGEPQHDDDPMIYRRTSQVGAGIEWERRLDVAGGWTSACTLGQLSAALSHLTAPEELDAAYDARTGEMLWEFNTVPQPGEIGHESWLDDGWRDRPSTTRHQLSDCLVALAHARRAADTEVHDLQAVLTRIPGSHTLIVISDMPAEAWRRSRSPRVSIGPRTASPPPAARQASTSCGRTPGPAIEPRSPRSPSLVNRCATTARPSCSGR